MKNKLYVLYISLVIVLVITIYRQQELIRDQQVLIKTAVIKAQHADAAAIVAESRVDECKN